MNETLPVSRRLIDRLFKDGALIDPNHMMASIVAAIAEIEARIEGLSEIPADLISELPTFE